MATAALEAGKMVYCEWPLGRNLEEAEKIAELARRRRLATVIGLQGRFAPAVRYLRDLVAAGSIGSLLGTRIAGTGADDLWKGVLAPEYELTADPASGNTLLAIPAGHGLEMLAFALGDFASVSSTLIARRTRAVRLRDHATIPLSMHDQIAISGALENGALASVHYHGGGSAGPSFVWEINGSDGDLLLTTEQGYANISELKLKGVRGDGRLEAMNVPDTYRLVPPGLPEHVVNVASLYAQFALDLAGGTALVPDFEVAVRRHRLIDAIERSNATGTRQPLQLG